MPSFPPSCRQAPPPLTKQHRWYTARHGSILFAHTQLAKIARQLASTNYKKYPPISSEIVGAADAVDAATGTLTNAVIALQNSQTRRQGWEGLVDACRIMAGYTIRLLQVVYGADWERINFARDEGSCVSHPLYMPKSSSRGS